MEWNVFSTYKCRSIYTPLSRCDLPSTMLNPTLRSSSGVFYRPDSLARGWVVCFSEVFCSVAPLSKGLIIRACNWCGCGLYAIIKKPAQCRAVLFLLGYSVCATNTTAELLTQLEYSMWCSSQSIRSLLIFFAFKLLIRVHCKLQIDSWQLLLPNVNRKLKPFPVKHFSLS